MSLRPLNLLKSRQRSLAESLLVMVTDHPYLATAATFLLGMVGKSAASCVGPRDIDASTIGKSQPGYLIEAAPGRSISAPVTSLVHSNNTDVNGTHIPDTVAVPTNGGVALVTPPSADAGNISLSSVPFISGSGRRFPMSMAAGALSPTINLSQKPLLAMGAPDIRTVFIIDPATIPPGGYNMTANCTQPYCERVVDTKNGDSNFASSVEIINQNLFVVGKNGTSIYLFWRGHSILGKATVEADDAATLQMPALPGQKCISLTGVPAPLVDQRGAVDGFATTARNITTGQMWLHYVPNGPLTLDDKNNVHISFPPQYSNINIVGGVINGTNTGIVANCGDAAYVITLNAWNGTNLPTNTFSVENPPVTGMVLKIDGVNGTLVSIDPVSQMIMIPQADNIVKMLDLTKINVTYTNGVAHYKLGDNPGAESSVFVTRGAFNTNVGTFNSGSPVVCDTDKCYVPDLTECPVIESSSEKSDSSSASCVGPFRDIDAKTVGNIQPGNVLESTKDATMVMPIVSLPTNQTNSTVPDPIAVATTKGVGIIWPSSQDTGTIPLNSNSTTVKLVDGIQKQPPASMAAGSLSTPAVDPSQKPQLAMGYPSVQQVVVLYPDQIPSEGYDVSKCALPFCRLITDLNRTNSKLGGGVDGNGIAILNNNLFLVAPNADCVFSTLHVSGNNTGCISVFYANTLLGRNTTDASAGGYQIPHLPGENITSITAVPSIDVSLRGIWDSWVAGTGATSDGAVKAHYQPFPAGLLDGQKSVRLIIPGCPNPSMAGGLVNNQRIPSDIAIGFNCGGYAYIVQPGTQTGLTLANNTVSLDNPPAGFNITKITGLYEGSRLIAINSKTNEIMLPVSATEVRTLKLKDLGLTYESGKPTTYAIGSNPNAERSIFATGGLNVNANAGTFNGDNPVVCDAPDENATVSKCYIPDVTKCPVIESSSEKSDSDSSSLSSISRSSSHSDSHSRSTSQSSASHSSSDSHSNSRSDSLQSSISQDSAHSSSHIDSSQHSISQSDSHSNPHGSSASEDSTSQSNSHSNSQSGSSKSSISQDSAHSSSHIDSSQRPISQSNSHSSSLPVTDSSQSSTPPESTHSSSHNSNPESSISQESTRSSSQSVDSHSATHGASPLPMIIGIAGGAGAVLVIVVGGVIVCAIIAHKRNGARERLFLRPEIEMSSVAVVPSSAAVTKTKSSDNSVDKKFDISDLSHWHQVVGEGSFGKVWKCTYTPQDGPVAFVAVKCLDKISDDIDLTSSQREIHISTSCNSPYILPSFGSQEFKRKCDAYPKVWIIMPFMDGGPLDGWLKENKEEGKKTNGQLILRMALEIIRGIHYLHEVMNVIHRDLKPSNILLTSKEDPHAKISDFGTSRSVESDGTLTKEPVGTHDYLAPELLKPDLEEPKQPADKRSDIYALALILWALLTGDRPYDDFYEKQKRQGADYWATKAAFCSYIQTAEGRPKISSSLASRFGFMTEIIKNAWDTDPTRRPTAEKMKNDLETAPQMQEVVQAEDLYVQSLSQTS